jgi:protein translocase SecG subunit
VNPVEIIISVVIILLGLFVVYLFMYHESKEDGMTTAISGGYDGGYAVHSSSSRQKKIDKLLGIFSILFILIVIGSIIYYKFF